MLDDKNAFASFNQNTLESRNLRPALFTMHYDDVSLPIATD